VAGQVGRVADVPFTQELGVIGHGGEVERAGEPHASQGPPLGVEGLDAERLPAREAVGVGRAGSKR
jgi:hypothetical protein